MKKKNQNAVYFYNLNALDREKPFNWQSKNVLLHKNLFQNFR